MSFASIYQLYIQKAEKKERTKTEVDEIIFWLTGFNKETLQHHNIDKETDFDFFFQKYLKSTQTLQKSQE